MTDQHLPPPAPGPQPPASPWTTPGEDRPAGSSALPPTAARTPGSSENVAARLFRALVDLRFDRSIVLEGAGIVYVLWIVFVVLQWLGMAALCALIGFQRVSGYYGDGHLVAPWLPLVVLLLGWIPALFWILIGRVVLEFLCAGVRTARETALIRETLETRGHEAAAPTPSAPSATTERPLP